MTGGEGEEIATGFALATTSSDCRASPFAMLRASAHRNDMRDRGRGDCFVAGAPRNDMPVEGEEYGGQEIATGFALATTSSDCRVLLRKDSQ
jgi:hypothetical protein